MSNYLDPMISFYGKLRPREGRAFAQVSSSEMGNEIQWKEHRQCLRSGLALLEWWPRTSRSFVPVLHDCKLGKGILIPESPCENEIRQSAGLSPSPCEVLLPFHCSLLWGICPPRGVHFPFYLYFAGPLIPLNVAHSWFWTFSISYLNGYYSFHFLICLTFQTLTHFVMWLWNISVLHSFLFMLLKTEIARWWSYIIYMSFSSPYPQLQFLYARIILSFKNHCYYLWLICFHYIAWTFAAKLGSNQCFLALNCALQFSKMCPFAIVYWPWFSQSPCLSFSMSQCKWP